MRLPFSAAAELVVSAIGFMSNSSGDVVRGGRGGSTAARVLVHGWVYCTLLDQSNWYFSMMPGAVAGRHRAVGRENSCRYSNNWCSQLARSLGVTATTSTMSQLAS
jgi:hypothetical protein